MYTFLWYPLYIDREMKTEQEREIEKDRFIFRNWPMRLWEVGESRMCRADWQKSCRSGANNIHPWSRQVSLFSVKSFNWLDEVHHSKGRSAVYRFKCSSHPNNTVQQHLDWCWTKQLGTMASEGTLNYHTPSRVSSDPTPAAQPMQASDKTHISTLLSI